MDEWYGVLVPEAAKATGKVAFRLIATQLEAALLPAKEKVAGRSALLLPDQSVRFIQLKRSEEANYLAGIMNSSALRCIAYLCATPKGGVPWRAFKAWNVGFIPVIKYQSTNPLCASVSDMCSEFSKKTPDENGQKDLDEAVARLYGITHNDIVTLADHLRTMQGMP